MLGHRKHFLPPQKLDNTSYQPNPRQSALHEHFQAQDENVYYIDQKALTGLIAHHFNQHGQEATTAILRAGFGQYNEEITDEKLKKEIDKVVDFWVKKIPIPPKDKKLIVLHVRHSGDANEEQNLNPEFVKGFKKYLEKKGYVTCIIFISSGDPSKILAASGIDKDHLICPFDHHSVFHEKDFGKFIHFGILARILDFPYLKGIIGNTSGTLDLAAFMGHNVYNIHRFKNDKAAYQDYRLLMQGAFFAAEHYEANEFKPPVAGENKSLKDDEVNALLRNFSQWLNSPELFRLAPTINFHEPTKKVNKVEEVNYHIPGYVELLFLKTFNAKDGAPEIKRTKGPSFFVENFPKSSKANIKSVSERYIVTREELLEKLMKVPQLQVVKSKNVTKEKTKQNTEKINNTIADYVGVALTRK